MCWSYFPFYGTKGWIIAGQYIIKNVSDGWCLRCELGHCICIYVSSIWCIVLYLTWLGQLCSALSSAQPHSTAVGQATLTLVHHTIMDLDILSVQGDLMLHTGWLHATQQTPIHGNIWPWFHFQPFIFKVSSPIDWVP